ncbi:MAG: peptidylprolyl isomerase [Planctomycetota bacterium]
MSSSIRIVLLLTVTLNVGHGQILRGQEPPAEGPSQVDLFTEGEEIIDRESLTEREQKELDKFIEDTTKRYQAIRERLAEEMIEMRSTYILYVNEVERSPSILRRYEKQRETVRKSMDELYKTALDLAAVKPSEAVAHMIMHMVKHRMDRSLYDSGLAMGASTLVEGGSQDGQVYLAAARAGIATGRLDLAESLYKNMKIDALPDLDANFYRGLEDFREVYEKEGKVREKEAESDDLPRVKLDTSQGEIELDLFINEAPSAVSHFIQKVENGDYDDAEFFQVVDDLFAVAGEEGRRAVDNGDRFLLDEHTRPDHRPALYGAVVMMKFPTDESGNYLDHSATHDFAITYVPMIGLSEKMTVIGRVVSGMNAATHLRRVNPAETQGKGKVSMLPICVRVEKRSAPHSGRPKKQKKSGN